MARRDFRGNFGSEEEYPILCQTFLPHFPAQNDILRQFPTLAKPETGLSKIHFLPWTKFTLDFPDEIWEADESPDSKIYYYLNFVGEQERPPVFVVEVRWLDDFTEVFDYSLVIEEADLARIRSGEPVYCLHKEWQRESLVRKLNELALRKYDEDCLKEACNLIDRAIELSGARNAYLFNNRGLIHWKMGRINEAKEDFLESVKLEEGNADAYFNLGLIYFDESDFEPARRYLQRAVSINPCDGQFLTELGHLYLELGREKEALQLFGRATKNSPDDPQVDFHLGHYFLYKKNKPEKAVKYYDRGLKKDPQDQLALADLAVAHWAVGNRQKTMGIRSVLQAQSQLLPYTVSRLVYLNMEMGDYERALKYYRQALSQNDPFEPEWLHYNAALVYAKTGKPRQALDRLSLAVRVGGEAVIKRARSDKALKQLKGTTAFKKLIKLPAGRRNR